MHESSHIFLKMPVMDLPCRRHASLGDPYGDFSANNPTDNIQREVPRYVDKIVVFPGRCLCRVDFTNYQTDSKLTMAGNLTV
jgi:hypothetical protein